MVREHHYLPVYRHRLAYAQLRIRRPHAWLRIPVRRAPVPGAQLLELEYPDGVRDYLSGQLSTADVDEVMAELEKNVPLRRLTLNPLLLQLITTVYLRTGRLPDSRVKLLDGISWELLGRLEVSVESSVPGAAGTRAACGAECCHTLLRALGYAMRREGLELPSERVAEIFRAAAENVPPRRNEDAAEPPPSRAPHPSTDRTRLIDELVRARLLMRDVGTGRIRFWHQTIQEYFAACHMCEGVRLRIGSRRRLRGYLWRRLRDPTWREIIAMVAGLLSEAQAHPDRSDLTWGPPARRDVPEQYSAFPVGRAEENLR